MKRMLLAAALAACVGIPAYAADAPAAGAKPVTAQQQKMKDCNADAGSKGLKGADRKAFMKTCLSKDGAADAPAASAAPATPAPLTGKAAQQQKMKDCNTEATGKALKGADRKSFMSTCLKGSADAAAK